MSGINVGSVFMDSYINTAGFMSGAENIKSHSNSIFSGISAMIATEWTNTRARTDTELKGLFDTAGSNFNRIKNDIGIKMKDIKDGVGVDFSAVTSITNEKTGLAKDYAGSNIGLMRLKFGELSNYLGGDFTNSWDKTFEGLKTSFGTVWDGILTIIKTAVNGCIKMMNSFIGGIWNSIKSVADTIGNLIQQFGELIGFNDWGFSMPEAPQIPMLAKGGIVNQPTLAMIGERGSEAVIPLENNTGWMADLANMIGAAVESNGAMRSRAGENVARLYIDGKQIAEAIFDDIKNAGERRGVGVAL